MITAHLSTSVSNSNMMFLRLSFIVIFSGILVMPLLGLFFNFNIGEPVAAGKTKFPEFSLAITQGKQKLQYFDEFEAWFNSNHALEGLYIRIFNEVRHYQGISKELVIGKDGWLADKKTVQDYLVSLDSIPDDDLQSTIETAKRLQNYLRKRDVFFMIAVIPLKSTVFPEKFPQLEERPHTGYQRFQEAFELNSIPTIDLVDTMRSAPYLPYYKTDVHFNPYGAYLASQKILELLYSSFNLDKPNIEAKISTITRPGTSANNAMPKIFPFTEEYATAIVPPAYESGRRVINADQVINAGQEDVKFFKVQSSDYSLLPKTIMFGNSFMLTYDYNGFYNHFKEHSRVLDYKEFKHVLDYIEDDVSIFILHVYESQLWFHLNVKQNINYWDARLNAMPLPEGYNYISPEKH